ncbi:MAG: alpha/beta hydrolase, partial [Gammaproteobacteria bacterium]
MTIPSEQDPGAPAVTRQTVYFGEPGAQCFGWRHEPATLHGDIGVVLCPTLGAESLSTHRVLRALADVLAARGVPVLRFDYRSTGDSGDGSDGKLDYNGCVDDICQAIAVMGGTTGVQRVCVLGVRLGAAFAAAAAARVAVAGLVLWGPVVTGRRFAREWKLLTQASAPPADVLSEYRSGGFQLDEAFLDALAGLDLLTLAPLGGPACLVVEREELAPEDKLVAHLEALGLPTTRVRPGGFVAGMLADPHLSALPEAAIGTIADWIPQHCAAMEPAPGDTVPPCADTLELGAIREWPLDPSRVDGLFGIVTEPLDPAQADGRLILLLNSGSMHHIGPNGMYVAFARQLAA